MGRHSRPTRALCHGVRPRGSDTADTALQRPIRKLRNRNPVRQLQRRLEAVGEPGGDVLPDDDAVHHHVDVVLVFLVELGRLADLIELAVDLDALEALLLQLGQLLAVLALAPAHDRGQQIEPRPLRQRQHAVHHLRDRLALDRQTGGRRVGHADAREQQAQVVVDLRDRADGGAGVLGGGLLLDGDGRRQPVDMVDIGLLHHLQELARVGRQALDVAPLPLGIDGVEGERGLARARQPREHDQRVARDLEVDVLQVVLARAADMDGLAGLGGRFAHDLRHFSVLCLPPGQPALHRHRVLRRRSTGNERGYADVLVHVRPVNTLTARDQMPVGALCGAGVEQPRIPGQGSGNASTVRQLNGQSIVRHGDRRRRCMAVDLAQTSWSGNAGLGRVHRLRKAPLLCYDFWQEESVSWTCQIP